MLSYLLKPKQNVIDWMTAYFVGYLMYDSNYWYAIPLLVVGSFISGFLESWYERKTNGTFTD
jgi:uncharacterized membrane protein YraQ (UPF0718 family)